MLHYNGKPHIPETLRADLLKKNHDDLLQGHFGVEKTLELLSRKYYWPKKGLILRNIYKVVISV